MSQLIKSKKEKAQALLKKQEILRCPHCKEPMHVDGFTLGCANHHFFDISKKGYVNVATSKGDEQYDHALFEARKTMIHQGLFLPLLQCVQEIIKTKTSTTKNITMLDVGCGDGSFLSNLHQSLIGSMITSYGLDLSKEAIALATSEKASIAWLVGDLKNIPFLDHTMDVVLNVFSPANYAEFKRILKPNGFLIKVIPVENHFKEVRKIHQASQYPIQKTSEIKQALLRYATLESCTPLTYAFPLEGYQRELITTMSPLSKNQQKNVTLESNQVTIDVEILVATFNDAL